MIDTFTDRRFREPEVLNVRFVREEGRARVDPLPTTERNAMTALKRAQRCATVAFRCVEANARDDKRVRDGVTGGGRRNAREISLGNAQEDSFNEFTWNERTNGWRRGVIRWMCADD